MGDASAILDEKFGAASRTVRARDGVVTVSADDLAGRHDEAVKTLTGIKGVSRVEMVAAAAPGDKPPRTRPETGRLPGGQLFNPLIADPRWPHFSASYQRYLGDGQLRDVGAVSFGETFALYRAVLGPGFWEVGVQAGVFAVFDMDAESRDLVNADYFAAAIAGYRLDRLSVLARLAHTEQPPRRRVPARQSHPAH